LPDPEHDAGGGRIDAEDRGDAGDVAKEDGRCVAELLTDPIGKDDLVRCYSPSSAATSSQDTTSERSPWRMRSTKARHSSSCSAEGTGGSIGLGVVSVMRAAYLRAVALVERQDPEQGTTDK